MKCDNLPCDNVMKAVCDAMFQEQLNGRGATPTTPTIGHVTGMTTAAILIENTNSIT